LSARVDLRQAILLQLLRSWQTVIEEASYRLSWIVMKSSFLILGDSMMILLEIKRKLLFLQGWVIGPPVDLIIMCLVERVQLLT